MIVTFKSKPKTADLINISQKKKKSRMKYSITGSRSIVFEATGSDLKSAIDEMKTEQSVENVFEDKKLEPLYLPNDLTIRATPIPGKPRLQWDMFNLNLAGSGRSAWDISKGSPQIIVAVLDSGIDSSHEDLATKIVSLVDCGTGVCRTVSSMTADPLNLDASHGTHVAGIIGAHTDNLTGMAGSGFNTSLMPIKLNNVQGEMLVSAFVNAVRFAADQGVRIINISAGSLEGNLDGPVISEFNNAISYAFSKNVLVVAAAGNCGWDVSHHQSAGDPCDIFDANGNFVRHAVNEKFYPAASPNVLSVAALDVNNNPAPYSEHNDPVNGNWVSMAAPGGFFESKANKEFGIASSWPGNGYFFSMGTSSASPQVAGIAALILAVKPTLTNVQLMSLIEQTGNRAIAPGFTNFGMIDAVRALDSVNLPVNTPTRIPTVTIGFLTPTKTPTPFVSLTPTRTPTRTPTANPSVSTGTPTRTPTKTPTHTPTQQPGASPTGIFVISPTPTSILPTITQMQPSPTIQVNITPETCNNNPNSASCFFAWIYEYTRTILTKFTDFNKDGKIDLIDFEIWRRSNL